MAPATTLAVRKRRLIQDDLDRMFKRRQQVPTANPGLGTFKLLVAGLFFILVLFFYLQPETSKTVPSIVQTLSGEQTDTDTQTVSGDWQTLVTPVFNPQPRLTPEQMKIYEFVDTVPNHPERYGLNNLDLSELGLSEAQLEVFKALVLTESVFKHYDPDTGLVLTSEAGCWGITQGCNDMCPKDFWLVPTTNVWCGAKTFKWFWDYYKVDQNVFMLHYALAGYKGAFEMEEDGDGVKTVKHDPETGLPIIDPDLEWQPQKAEAALVWVPVKQ